MTTPLSLAAVSCLLFVPGNRPDRYAKALAASPDGIVIDLEDAVPAPEKSAARMAVASFLSGRDAAAGRTVFVRINGLASRAGLADLAALADGALAPDGLVLPKVEEARDVEIVRALLPDAAPDGCALVATIETARGLTQAEAVARSVGTTGALGFGGADLATDLGAAMSWEPLFHVRAGLVRAAALAGTALLDVPCLDIAALDALREEALRVRALGYTGKFAIHPSQVAPIRAAFAPSADEIARARRVIDAAARGGVAVVDGRMVDAPVIAASRRLLRRAGQAS